MSIHIAIAASKGGTGKTTTTWNLGFGLAMAGARVLLVDLDPQDNLRFISGADHARGTVASALEHGTFSPNHIRESIWLLPSGGRRLWQVTVSSDGLGNLTAPLRHALAVRDEEYDFILMDCPPELGRMTSAALSLSDYLLIPCVSTWLGLRSIEQMIEFIDTHTRDARIDSERTGIVMTFYTTRRAGPEMVRHEAKKLFHSRVLRTVIRERTELDYSQEAHKSVFEYAPRSDAAEDYTALTKEVIRRLG
ncbi:MAG TPA: ParA family protein [Blastocatellia bacterium]|nr:ParA family protein [Blastocatellia bacterium]